MGEVEIIEKSGAPFLVMRVRLANGYWLTMESECTQELADNIKEIESRPAGEKPK